MNTCSKCGLEKEDSCFNKELLNINKLSSWCKDCKNKQSKVWRSANKEKDTKRKEVWYNENRDEQIRKSLLWSKEHPEKKLEYTHVRRARLKSSGRVTGKEWEGVLEKYGRKCLCCGSKESITLDHVIPLSLGGSNTVDNIQPLCKTCNSRKKNKHIDYR